MNPENEYNLPLGVWKHKIDIFPPPGYLHELLTYYWDYTEGPPS